MKESKFQILEYVWKAWEDMALDLESFGNENISMIQVISATTRSSFMTDDVNGDGFLSFEEFSGPKEDNSEREDVPLKEEL